MPSAFVWFHNSSSDPAATARFYQSLLGWQPSAGPCDMTMLAHEAQPVASVAGDTTHVHGWVPYAAVADVDAAAKQAVKLGARVLQPKTRGPAGYFVVVRDPGGAAIALWQAS